MLFDQSRVARLNLTRHAAAKAICSRSSRGGGGFGMERVREGGGAARIETADRIANGPQGVRQQTEVLRPAFLPMVPW